MSDALFGLLIARAAWAAAALGRRPGRYRAIVLGGVLGLGAATKLSPLAVAAGMTLAILLVVGVSAARRRSFLPEHKSWTVLGLLVSATASPSSSLSTRTYGPIRLPASITSSRFAPTKWPRKRPTGQ